MKFTGLKDMSLHIEKASKYQHSEWQRPTSAYVIVKAQNRSNKREILKPSREKSVPLPGTMYRLASCFQ